jgi:hypothetical protein
MAGRARLDEANITLDRQPGAGHYSVCRQSGIVEVFGMIGFKALTDGRGRVARGVRPI